MSNALKKSALLLFCLIFPLSANASIVTLNLDTVYSGSSPDNAGPWVKAAFEDVIGGVLLTITALNLGKNEFISDLYFNLNPDKSLHGMNITYKDGVKPAGYLMKNNNEKAGPIHDFDIDIAYQTSKVSGRFDDDSVTQLLISGISGLTASDFAYTTQYKKASYSAAAHIQGSRCDRSEWVGADPPTPMAVTPEPASMLLMGIGLVGMVAMKRRSRGRRA